MLRMNGGNSPGNPAFLLAQTCIIRFMRMANNLRFPEIPPAFFPLIGPEFALIFYAAKDQRWGTKNDLHERSEFVWSELNIFWRKNSKSIYPGNFRYQKRFENSLTHLDFLRAKREWNRFSWAAQIIPRQNRNCAW